VWNIPHLLESGQIAMAEGSFWPKSWTEARPQIVWAVLIFAFGFEGVGFLIPCIVHLLQGKPWLDDGLQAALGLAGMVGLTAADSWRPYTREILGHSVAYRCMYVRGGGVGIFALRRGAQMAV
jgi:hypothetical protein